MKGFKKLLTGILAATMVMATSITAFATETTPATNDGEVTIDNAIPNQEYKLYKLFDFENADVEGEGVYKITSEWAPFFEEGEAGAEYITVDANGYVKWNGDQPDDTDNRADVLKANVGDAQEFAQAALAYAKANKIKAVDTKTAGAAAEGSERSVVKFTGLGYGYYLVGSGAGALVGLNTLTGDEVTIHEKNDTPTVDKEVKEDSGKGEYQKQNDAEIGQVVEYRTTIHAKAHGTGYKLYDKMDEGLTFNANSVNVTVGGTAVDSKNWALTSGGDYTAEGSNDATFTITFTDEYTQGLATDTDIVVTYTATVNDKAVKNVALTNKTLIEFGNKTRSEESFTRTYAWGIEVVKYTGANAKDGTKLEGAKFVIYKDVLDEAGAKVGIAYAQVEKGKLTGWTAADTTTENLSNLDLSYFEDKGATVFTSDANGKIDVDGLDADSYSLLEVVAPVGYNKLTSAVNFVVKSTVATAGKTLENELTQVDDDGKVIDIKEIDVQNNAGSLLPSTGGIGTTIFYVVGGLLIVAGVAYFMLRRKVDAE